jgi:hypothetical protein
MNLNDLTIEQTKELAAMFSSASNSSATLNGMVGKQVIIRTYSAGVWFGTLSEKSGNEVIISNARRMWRWFAFESISLSAVALHGIKEDKSQIVEAVPHVWLEAIEIIPCSEKAASQIAGTQNAKA